MIKGLDDFQKMLEDVMRAAKELEEQGIAQVTIDPNDPEAAIKDAERQIDEKLDPYGDNPIVDNIKEQLKDMVRRNIAKQATDD